MRFLMLFAILIFATPILAQDTAAFWIDELRTFQKKLNQEFSDPEETPLKKKDLKRFDGLKFFPANDTFYVEAEFIRSVGEEPFEMPTTTDRKPIYVKYGELHFELKGKEYTLSVYQNQELTKKDGYEDYLFLPFNDLTNGRTTYGGGRFIDFRIPNGNLTKLDFNKAYNPYCAYNHEYSCPIPPVENDLPVMVNAGVKAFEK